MTRKWANWSYLVSHWVGNKLRLMNRNESIPIMNLTLKAFVNVALLQGKSRLFLLNNTVTRNTHLLDI
jgi:hypothetical protein